jgi:hypothetical protein
MISQHLDVSTRKTLALAGVLFVIAFVYPAGAMATSPSSDQYGSRSEQIAATGSGGSNGGGGGPPQPAKAGSPTPPLEVSPSRGSMSG